MAANWELQLIAEIVTGENPSESFEHTQREGVRFAMFGGSEARALWAEIDAYYRRPHNFGHIPSIESLQESFPSLDLPRPVENLIDLCEKVRVGYMRREAEKLVNDYMTSVATDPLSAITDMHTGLGQLQERTTVASDVSFTEVALGECIRDIEGAEANDGVTGMPWPWMRLNRATGGIHQGDFIMVWALPKSMKTWFGLVIAAHLFHTGRRVLIYSKEMTWDSIRRRITSILARVNYTKLKEGTLSPVEKAHYLDTVERMADSSFSGKMWFTSADRADGTAGGPAEIRRKIELYQPHFVLLDSSYMLELPNAGSNALDWKQLSLVNRQLKQIAKSTGTPLLSILQENERSAMKYNKSRGTASLAMNTGAVMDCDIGIRLVYHSVKQELSLHLAAARETTESGFTIHAHASENFGYAHDTLHGVGDDFKEEQDNGNEAAVTPDNIVEIPISPLMSQARGGVRVDEIDDDLSDMDP